MAPQRKKGGVLFFIIMGVLVGVLFGPIKFMRMCRRIMHRIKTGRTLIDGEHKIYETHALQKTNP
jgi:hypothetical protein